MKTIFDLYSKKDIDNKIKHRIVSIKEKLKDEEILSNLDYEMKEEILSIARARVKMMESVKKDVGEAKYYNLNDLRFSTPEVIALYRANRLKCNKIVDLCSGVGIQSIAFSKTCEKVIGIEIDERKVKYSIENLIDKKNVQFICGDVLDPEIIEKVGKIKPDVIFCDPERKAEEKERGIESIVPDIKKLIDVYSKITPNLCIELPPQIDINKLKSLGDFEAEYITLGNKLNRLDLMFGNLKKPSVSVVDANSGERLEKSPKDIEIKKSTVIQKYIYEVSSAISKAGLIGELVQKIGGELLINDDKNRVLLTSGKLNQKEVNELVKSYKVIDFGDSYNDTLSKLKRNLIGKVVLRGSVDPKDYWKERNSFERSLRGNKESDLFVLIQSGKKKYLICEKL